MVAPATKRRAAGHLLTMYGISQRRVCRLLSLHRSVARYRSISGRDDTAVEIRLKALAQQYPRYGYLMLHHLMRAEALMINCKRTYRIYTGRSGARRSPGPAFRCPYQAERMNDWSVDFVSDQLANGRRFRILNIVDDYSRECVGQIVDFLISGERLSRFLDEGAHSTITKNAGLR
jgi:putative transposase